MLSTQTGLSGFQWFFGQVVDTLDPDQLGRVKVFVYGENSETNNQEDFRWAIPVLPVTSPSGFVDGVSAGSTNNLVVGATVFGFFADGPEKQHPMILGSIHTTPEYPARRGTSIPEQSTINRQKPSISAANDPTDTSNVQYPLNAVYTSPAGHTVEIDSSPGAERVAIHHKSGSYVEIDGNGDIIAGSTRATHQVTKNDHNITTNKGDIRIAAESGNIQIVADKKLELFGKEGVVISTPKDVAIKTGGGVSVQGGLTTTGAIADGTAASGAFSTPSGKIVTVGKGIVKEIK